ncbi:N-6 DNA methylase [Trueperella bernardiae]|uniref:N-6 DNA methylase n=1 Tax=Trueperella bernardiae TaxID=59561 RepID=UPI00294A534B|nr:N-6 DNA methylase [Trueperella bernardiae]MDV6239656.1 N-6 DNA methylase [Trueperella bernardiae]
MREPDNPLNIVESLVKSKQRVSDHGEVFTPAHIVEAMLDLVKDESERIDSRFLEPACGEGAFLRQVLLRKLATVQDRYGKNEFERRHYALLALMCIYGIELLEDNAQLCRNILADIFTQFINDPADTTWEAAAHAVLEVNIVQADALTMKCPDGTHIVFPEWGYLGKGRFQRRDFQYSDLTKRSSYVDTLFAAFDDDDIFRPKVSYTPMYVADIAESRQ